MKSYFLTISMLFISIGLFSQYADVTGANTGWEYITNVSIADINNSSVDDDADGDGNTGYDLYINKTAYLNENRTYTISVEIEPDLADPYEYVTVFFDWNGDYDFQDANEEIIVANNVGTSGPHTATVNVPTISNPGSSRMRVMLQWDSSPSSNSTPTFGEVEDYPINLSKYNYIYLGDWDSQGLPNYLFTPSDNITSGTIALINNVLPESTANLDYIDYNDYLNVSVDTGTRIWASFIDEGAGWKNTFAMYQYPTSSAPNSTSDIDSLTIIFPNVSGTGTGIYGGGSLTSGAKVYYDSVSAGTTVAFALIAGGWDNTHTTSTIDNTGNYIHYSNNNLNIESVDSLKAHNVTFWDSNQEKYILGFEDIDRESSSCDQDFNDVLFYITLDPIPVFNTGGSSGSEEQPPDIENPDDTGLPVEWLNFEANSNNSCVTLRWYIASQINNDYFIVERSKDMIEFEEVAKIDGHGTTSQLIRYSSIDYNPIKGESYYRIKQVDFDGKTDYSEVVSVNYISENVFIALYPNPLNQNELNIRSQGLKGNIQLDIYDSRGAKVYSENFFVRSDFYKQINTAELNNGIYYIQLKSSKSSVYRKLLINR